jgi:hypothetical protein
VPKKSKTPSRKWQLLNYTEGSCKSINLILFGVTDKCKVQKTGHFLDTFLTQIGSILTLEREKTKVKHCLYSSSVADTKAATIACWLFQTTSQITEHQNGKNSEEV